MTVSRDFGVETVDLADSIGRVLKADIVADRDIPAGNLATMDGIAIRYDHFITGTRVFRISATQAAGSPPVHVSRATDCIEITTGAELAPDLDVVIPYEQLNLAHSRATLESDDVRRWQYVRRRGEDTRTGGVLVKANCVMGAKELAIAATVGATKVTVGRLPRVAVITTGDELVDVQIAPASYQIRRSNSLAIATALHQRLTVQPDSLHLPDKPTVLRRQLASCLDSYEVIIICGGVSKGAFDYVPDVLAELGVKRLFSGVKQKPGKPLWFGVHPRGAIVFALPGNPLSSFLCLHRYVLPWLYRAMGIPSKPLHARLERDISFEAPLQFFPLVSLRLDRQGQLLARPVKFNSSGDLTGLADADAYIELPAVRKVHHADKAYKVWPFRDVSGGG